MHAIRVGIVTPTTRAALLSAEAAQQEAEESLRAAEAIRPADILPRARDVYRELVAKLEKVENVAEAREAIRGLLGGSIRITREADRIWAEAAECKMTVVAGAGFEPTTFGL